jgi:transposase
VVFHHRSGEWAVQATNRAVRYDIAFDPARGRWYLDASWQVAKVLPPSLAELRRQPALGVDLNARHLDCWVLDPVGNPVGRAHTIPLDLTGLPASTRDGHLRGALSATLRIARATGCRSIVVENLDFTDARQVGRESLGRGRRGKRFRRSVSGMPTRRFRDLLVGMAANAGLWVVAVDPGWTSVWGRRYWQQPLNQSTKQRIAITGH